MVQPVAAPGPKSEKRRTTTRGKAKLARQAFVFFRGGTRQRSMRLNSSQQSGWALSLAILTTISGLGEFNKPGTAAQAGRVSDAIGMAEAVPFHGGANIGAYVEAQGSRLRAIRHRATLAATHSPASRVPNVPPTSWVSFFCRAASSTVASIVAA